MSFPVNVLLTNIPEKGANILLYSISKVFAFDKFIATAGSSSDLFMYIVLFKMLPEEPFAP